MRVQDTQMMLPTPRDRRVSAVAGTRYPAECPRDGRITSLAVWGRSAYVHVDRL